LLNGGNIKYLPLIATARESLWYLPVSREGPYSDRILLLRDCLRKALHSALKGAIQNQLRSRADEVVREALGLGCTEFDCWVDVYVDGCPIVLRFLNAKKDLVITRRLSYKRLLEPFGTVFSLVDAVDMKIIVQSRVLNTEGIKGRHSPLPVRKEAKNGGVNEQRH